MSLDSIVTVNVSTSAQVPSRVGFGTALLMCAGLPGAWAAVTSYDTVDDLGIALVSAGLTTSHASYQMAAALKSQNPSVTSFKVGKRATSVTQVIELTPADPAATAGKVYSVTINGIVCSYTSLITDTTDDICDGLASAINGLAGSPITATVSPAHPNATKVVCTSSSTAIHTFTSRSTGTALIKLTDATSGAATALVADLTAASLVDSDWYCVLPDNGSAMNEGAGATLLNYLASNHKIMVVQTADNAVIDAAYIAAGVTDLPSQLKTKATYRVFCLYSRDLNFLAQCSMAGNRLPADPGSDTWAYKTLSGVSVDALTPTQKANAASKNCNTYMTTSGINIVENGKSGGGEWMDVTRFSDWLRVRMQERLFFILANRQKLPYTDASVDVIRGEVLAQLNEGIQVGGLAASPAPIVTAPTVASISTATRATRQLPGVSFSAQLAGAIHQMTITGTVTA